MTDFRKMVIVPEKTFKDLQDVKTNSNIISPDIFNGDIDSRLMENLKNDLVKILNSDKVDKTTISKYKSDLAKLLDLESPDKSEMRLITRDTEPNMNYYKSDYDKNVSDVSDGPINIQDMDTTSMDTKFITGSESDLDESNFIMGVSDNSGGDKQDHTGTSTPNRKQVPYLDETIKNSPSQESISSRKRLVFGEGGIIPLLNPTDLKGENKSTSQNARNIEDFVLKNAPDRIKRISKDSFYIDGKKIKGDLASAIVDLSRQTKKKATELKRSSPGAKFGVNPLLRFLKGIQIPDDYLKNVRRIHDDTNGKKNKIIKKEAAVNPVQSKKDPRGVTYFQGYDIKL